ncbi:MAG: tetratricopeptide repeat protein [Thermoplasmata archaeon]|nr:tetratricopeptide repeat protein [Thermoplasmata archaeon]
MESGCTMMLRNGVSLVRSYIFLGVLGAVAGVRKGSVSKLITEGNEHYRKGRLGEAIKAYNQALQIDPDNPIAWNNKGLILAVAGNYGEALKCHKKAVELDPKHVDATSNVGMTYAKLNNFEDALIWYDKALKLNSSHETTWNNKGNLLSKLDRCDEALKCYDKALDINSNYMAAMNNKAVELIHLKNYDEALALLNKVLKSRPLFSEGWYVKGKAYIGMREFDKAIVCLERAHRLNPEFAQAKRALDVLKTKLVEPPGIKAKGTEKKVPKTESERVKVEKTIQKEILKPRSSTEIMGDEFERPEEHLTKDERLAQEYVTDEHQSSTLLKNAVGNKLSKPALDRALEGLERKGLVESKKVGRGMTYARTQDLGSIEEEIIEEREEQEPEDVSNDIHGLITRAKRYIDSGRYTDAASNLRKALKINPYDEMATCLLAQTQYEMGERDRAINTISKIFVQKPDFIPAWFTLANATLKAKEYTDATECFRKILELQPGNAEAKKGLDICEGAME